MQARAKHHMLYVKNPDREWVLYVTTAALSFLACVSFCVRMRVREGMSCFGACWSLCRFIHTARSMHCHQPHTHTHKYVTNISRYCVLTGSRGRCIHTSTSTSTCRIADDTLQGQNQAKTWADKINGLASDPGGDGAGAAQSTQPSVSGATATIGGDVYDSDEAGYDVAADDDDDDADDDAGDGAGNDDEFNGFG